MPRNAVIEVDMSGLLEDSPVHVSLIERMEVLKILKFGEKEGSGIARIKMKRGKSPSELSKDKRLLNFEILEKDKDEYICLIRKNILGIFFKTFSKYVNKKNIPVMISKYLSKDLYFDVPMIMTPGKAQVLLVGTQEAINGFLAMLEKLHVPHYIKSIKDYSEFKNPANLTQKQGEIVSTAYKLGYYNRPKKISSKKLSEIFGINQATLIEHLRKSEQKILKGMFG